MTAKALSPPNSGESLREQLILDGVIVSEKNESNNFNIIDDDIEHYFNLLKIKTEYINVFDEKYIQLVTGLCRQAESFLEEAESIENSDAEIKNKNLVVFYLRILSLTSLKSINKLLFILFKNLSEQVSILRSGFFFGFKENMKNTP